MKYLMILLVGFVICIFTILFTKHIGSQDRNQTKNEPKGIVIPQVLDGTENFTNIGKSLSISSDGTMAITGDSDTNSIQIYDMISIDESNDAFEIVGMVPLIQTNTSIQAKFVTLSGDGNFLVVNTNSYAQVYARPGYDDDSRILNWEEYGQRFPISNHTNNNTTISAVSISISHDGMIFAMAIPDFKVNVYKMANDNTNIWSLLGSSISKPFENSDSFGNSISLSSNGRRIAIGAEGSGAVYIYKFDGEDWTNLLNDNGNILGGSNNGNDRFGYSVSMNHDGSLLAVGSPEYSGYTDSLSNSGRCVIYDINEVKNNGGHSNTIVIGESIFGEEENENLGHIVQLSDDGNQIGISSIGKNIVRVFDLALNDSSKDHRRSWNQYRKNFIQEGAGYGYGRAISLSSKNTLLVGAPPTSDSKENLNGKIFLYSVI